MSAVLVEEWRSVYGYEATYSVSNLGHVRSEDRRVQFIDGRSRHFPGKMLTPCVNKHGYPEVSLHKLGKSRTWLVHQLVLYAFVGPKPDGLVCCHRDGDPSNPVLTNLRWDTQASNSADSCAHGVIKRGADAPGAKLTEAQAMAILRDPRTHRFIAADYGVTQSHISRIKSHDVWAHLRGELS